MMGLRTRQPWPSTGCEFIRFATDKDLGRTDRREGIAMGLTYCEGCQEMEGKTRDEDGVQVCAECGDEVTTVPEHDDGDLER